jgi:major membrane immunogen (membrane-anchored lipoprotein)
MRAAAVALAVVAVLFLTGCGTCDWYQATLRNAGWEVVLDQRHAACVLPF